MLRPTRSIRVLQVAPSLQLTGGQSLQASSLRAVLANEPSVDVAFQAINPRLPGVLHNLQRVKYLRTVLTWLVYVMSLAGRTWRYDIVHVFSAAHTSYALFTLPALAFSKLYGKSIVLHYHDGQAEDHLRDWRTALPTVRLMDAVIVPSGFLVDVFKNFGLRVEMISNMLDPGQFHYRKRTSLRPIFLHNRILEPIYNIPCSMRAFQIVQSRYPDASLTIAHEGPSRSMLEALARELGLRNTRFVGRVSTTEMAALYDAADIYLTSPDFDCMPGSILECFASGLPVVATSTGGIPYIAADQETALLVPVGDHQAMADAALSLLNDPALVERLTRNAQKSSQQYGKDAIGKQWVALYRSHQHAAADNQGDGLRRAENA